MTRDSARGTAPSASAVSSILIDGVGRSGTSLLGRLLQLVLEPQGWTYFYEPMKHPSPAGVWPGWEAMISRVLEPGDLDVELEIYLDRFHSLGPLPLWKEIRFALKQDWLLARYPGLRIVHLTRDILGVLSSHRRPDAPGWMDGHRRMWIEAVRAWAAREAELRAKRVPHLELLPRLPSMGDFELYSAMWTLNEGFAWGMEHPRLICVEYEDLCLFPTETLQRIAEFLGAKFDDAARAATWRHMQESMKEWDASGAGTGRPPREMPAIWRERLTPEEAGAIEAVAAPVRGRLGYPPVG